jgi:8-oxo-dGTP pyrophosphatase MutT (NUDIX family)
VCQSTPRRLTGAPAAASNNAMAMKEPDWLEWARELQAIAQTGITFCRDPYDRERYEAIRQLAARMFAARTDAPLERIEALFAGETGYATPKVDVRAAVFDDNDCVLMVRETSDGGRWTLPGGWADVNRTAAQNVVKEALEESGFDVEPLKLGAVWDRTKQGHSLTRASKTPCARKSRNRCVALREGHAPQRLSSSSSSSSPSFEAIVWIGVR